MEGMGSVPSSSARKEEHSMKIGNNDVKLIFSDTGISWIGSSKGRTGSIEWSDVLSVTPIPAGCKKPQGPGINLFYISRTKVEWRKTQVVFRSSDESQATAVAGKIAQNVQEKAIHRPKNLIIIVNPKSGGCKGVKIYDRVAHLFELASIRTQVQVTERAGHAIDILKGVDLAAFDGCVAVGGDGTYTECVSGLSLASAAAESIDLNDPEVDIPYINMRIGIIPAGTGQGNALLATGSTSPESSALHIIKGCSWNMDAFTVHNDRRYMSTACLLTGYGLFSEMIKKSESNRQLGRVRYLYAMFSTGMSPTPFHINVDILKPAENGNPPEWIHKSGEYINVGHMHFDYLTARDHDGRLYVSLTRKTSMFSIAKLMMKLKNMTPTERIPEWLDYFPASYFKITPYTGTTESGAAASENKRSSAAIPEKQTTLPFDSLNIDGESFPIDAHEIHVKIHPGRIKMFGSHPHAPRPGEEAAAAGSEEGATGTSF